jgi:hypothetical protein
MSTSSHVMSLKPTSRNKKGVQSHLIYLLSQLTSNVNYRCSLGLGTHRLVSRSYQALVAGLNCSLLLPGVGNGATARYPTLWNLSNLGNMPPCWAVLLLSRLVDSNNSWSSITANYYTAKRWLDVLHYYLASPVKGAIFLPLLPFVAPSLPQHS